MSHKFAKCQCCESGYGTLRYGKVYLCFECNRSAWVQCWSKLGHAGKFRSYEAPNGQMITAYPCELCQFWHGTSNQEQLHFNVVGSPHMSRAALLDWALRKSGFKRGPAKLKPS